VRLLLTTILFAILFVLGFISYPHFLLKKDLSLDETDPGQRISYGEHNVCSIEIRSKNGNIMLEKKRKNNWQMIQPFSWPVNLFAVQRFFQILGEDPDFSSGDRIILHLRDSTEKVFEGNPEGKATPSLQNLDEMLREGIGFWCQRKIFPFNADTIESLSFTFHEPKQYFSLTRNNGHWNFSQPMEIGADEPSLHEFLQWMTSLEVFPMEEDYFFAQFLGEEKGVAFADHTFHRLPHLTLTVVDEQQRKRNVTYGRFRKKGSGKTVFYGWLNDGGALFPVPWNEVLDHPLRFLSTRSLFPEIKSLTIAHGEQKLFLSCNESGEWSSFQFSQKSQNLRSLENFDVPALLSFFSAVKPLDVIPVGEISDPMPREKISLEINGTSRFEVLEMEEEIYLIPAKKHYAIVIARDFFEKLSSIMRGIWEKVAI
jgi:hypothetical protein